MGRVGSEFSVLFGASEFPLPASVFAQGYGYCDGRKYKAPTRSRGSGEGWWSLDGPSLVLASSSRFSSCPSSWVQPAELRV